MYRGAKGPLNRCENKRHYYRQQLLSIHSLERGGNGLGLPGRRGHTRAARRSRGRRVCDTPTRPWSTLGSAAGGSEREQTGSLDLREKGLHATSCEPGTAGLRNRIRIAIAIGGFSSSPQGATRAQLDVALMQPARLGVLEQQQLPRVLRGVGLVALAPLALQRLSLVANLRGASAITQATTRRNS